MAGNSEKEVTLNIDASAYTEELSKLMPNGYYLEGFVTFTSDVAAELSIPYVGFKGIWNEIPVLEKSIYDHKDGEKPFYFDNGTNDFTHLFSKVDSKIVVNGYDKNKTPMYDKKISLDSLLITAKKAADTTGAKTNDSMVKFKKELQ